MNKVDLNVNYVVDGILTVISTTMLYEQSNDEEIQNIYFELNLGELNIKSKVCTDTEYAIKHLQKSLPSNIKLVCCQSCRYGNFCPFGDSDNEIFCFKYITINSKSDLCEYFSRNEKFNNKRSRKLLDYCTEYRPISHNEYYTYR
ncbi:hypothetical protein KYB31_12385 [Clostridium felsineum]|uniref:hypothetical protein n=1 Tax=Clostridium felsineum TaxID=36839 RepID=UPI00214D7BB4|nr:hypothetical protein [Clostridium felsineum]MCR3759771.1 hypothetical protein [Clostridium felsineum]